LSEAFRKNGTQICLEGGPITLNSITKGCKIILEMLELRQLLQPYAKLHSLHPVFGDVVAERITAVRSVD